MIKCHMFLFMENLIKIFVEVQRQPFTDVLQNSCSLKFCNIRRKTPGVESLFNKVASLQTCNFTKKRRKHRCFPMNIAIFTGKHMSWSL